MSQPRVTDIFGNEDLIYLTMLTGMYNTNNTQIQNLQRANDNIRSSILTIINRNINNLPNNISNNSQNNSHNIIAPLQNLFYATPPLNNPRTPEYNPRTPEYNPSLFARHLTPPRAPINNRRRRPLQNDLVFDFEGLFSPVPIYPTPTQIEAATRNVRFSDIIRPMNTSCPISLETFNDNSQVTMIRHCGHIFNRDMLTSWFQSHAACPVCRYDIRDYVPSNTVNPNEDQNVRPTLVNQNNDEERTTSETDERPGTPDVLPSSLNLRISNDTQERIKKLIIDQFDNSNNNGSNNSYV